MTDAFARANASEPHEHVEPLYHENVDDAVTDGQDEQVEEVPDDAVASARQLEVLDDAVTDGQDEHHQLEGQLHQQVVEIPTSQVVGLDAFIRLRAISWNSRSGCP